MKGFTGHSFAYTGENTDKIAFPLGGMGSGCLFVSGTGRLGQFSLRHRPGLQNDPCVFAAVTAQGPRGPVSRVLEGPIPPHLIYSPRNVALVGAADGYEHGDAGLPRCAGHRFEAAFPFARVDFADDELPLLAALTAFSPFVPGDEDATSLPAAGLEYTFTNPGDAPVSGVFYFAAYNFMTSLPDFMRYDGDPDGGRLHTDRTLADKDGFTFYQPPVEGWADEGAFRVEAAETAHVDCDWFRGGWFDKLTMVWNHILAGRAQDAQAADGKSPGATLAVPFTVAPGGEKTVTLRLSWYVPHSSLRCGPSIPGWNKADPAEYFRPWYAARYTGIDGVSAAWREGYDGLRARSRQFADTLMAMALPQAALDAVSSNLCILKSPTILRQYDGRLWGWEGCMDDKGSCYGSCTHVWNYAQALCHLFPWMEQTLRRTEHNESQDGRGKQIFRTALPIRPSASEHPAACDGQLGGVIKTYREWRLSGDDGFLAELWPRVKQSLEYCASTWDPDGTGVIREPHHNTYDIEFWGPEPMGQGFYLGALAAASAMAGAMGEDGGPWRALYEKGRAFMESELFNGEYFFQRTDWKTLRARPDREGLDAQALALMDAEGPKYQYGPGCLSDGLVGVWLSRVCGLGDILDPEKIRSHLASVHRYNLKASLQGHSNPQRGGFALGREGGLLLCTWPRGGKPSLPFVYSDEVWTGIEYAAASHMLLMGLDELGMDVVRACRARYDGRVRNPFGEYECGIYYARAMASYALIEACGGPGRDARDGAGRYDGQYGEGENP